jgi:hypothetical protein
MKINEINVELSGNSQRYINECCESESDGKIDGFGAGCCKRRGGIAVAMWCVVLGDGVSIRFPDMFFRMVAIAMLVGALALWSAALTAMPTCAFMLSVKALGSEQGTIISWGRG